MKKYQYNCIICGTQVDTDILSSNGVCPKQECQDKHYTTPMEHLEKIKFKMIDIEEEWENVQHCPFCGSTQIEMPNDLCEWICHSCKRWYTIG
jgi:hypothetical protein